MRIVQFLPRMRLVEGGVVRAVIDLAGALAQAGHQVVVLTRDAADAPPAWSSGGESPRVETVDLGAIASLVTGGGPGGAPARVIRDADILHLHTPWEPANLGMAKLARRIRVPYVVTAHGMLDDWAMEQKSLKKKVYLALAGRGLLRRAACVHFTAEAEAEQSRRRAPRAASRVIPLLCDLSELADEPDAPAAPDDAPAGPVVFLGRVVPGKGVDLLIEAIARLVEAHPTVRLIVAGPVQEGMRPSLDQLVARLGLSNRVEFRGFVSGASKRDLLRSAGVVVSLSAHENFGLTLIEALACGAPVVTTRDVATWRELEAGGGAVIVERTIEAAARAIASLLAEPARARSMGATGRAHAATWLNPDLVREEYESMYRKALEGRV